MPSLLRHVRPQCPVHVPHGPQLLLELLRADLQLLGLTLRFRPGLWRQQAAACAQQGGEGAKEGQAVGVSCLFVSFLAKKRPEVYI